MSKNLFLFGYGSLISKSSFEQTLGYKLPDNLFRLVRLNGYIRSWTLCHSVAMYPEKKKILLPPRKKYIVYLDITPAAGASIIGSLVKVSSEELKRFDNREENYHRTDITNNLSYIQTGGVGYVYIGNNENKIDNIPLSECMIVKEYVDLIEKALSRFDPAIIDEYWKTTLKSMVDTISVPGFFDS